MKNDVKKKALQALASAPAIAAAEVLKTLQPDDRTEARRLFEALGIKPATVEKITQATKKDN